MEQVIYSTTPKWIAPQAFLKIKVDGVVAQSESYLCNLWEQYRELCGCLVPVPASDRTCGAAEEL
jgi:hypothetical protein